MRQFRLGLGLPFICLSWLGGPTEAAVNPLPSGATPAQSLSLEAQREAARLSRSIISPFCPGRTLDACPSRGAAKWRADIRSWLAQGIAEEEIRRRLQAQFPEVDISGRPSGFRGMLLVLVPLVLLAILVAWVGRRLLRGRRAESVEVTDQSEVADTSAYRKLLDDELGNYR